MKRTALLRCLTALALALAAAPATPYSIQTHEELIDLAWKQSIEPALLARYPALTPAQLSEAHAYAYGGCAIQDFGYYPFGNKFFSNLTHYVRSGDFVLALLHDARTPDEYAFAIGALAHYIGDTIGHGLAVNSAVPVEFPSLGRRYGARVSYAESPHAHVRTEFAFDVDQLSKLRFAPSGYLEHVGLEIPTPLLTRAFYETYGLRLRNLIGTRTAALRTYRFAARHFIPDIARAETLLHKDSFPADASGPELDRFVADLHQASVDNDWERYRSKPGFTSHLYAGFIFILPKVGPLSMLSIKGPTGATEGLYVSSVNRSIASLRFVLTHFDTVEEYVPNRDLDTGRRARPGSYPLADKTYAKLLAEITEHPERTIPLELKHDLNAYFTDPVNRPVMAGNRRKWAEVQAHLKVLAGMRTSGELDKIYGPDDEEEPGS